MATVGVCIIAATVTIGLLLQGATEASVLGGGLGTGIVMVIVGLREWRKGERMAADMRRRVEEGPSDLGQ